MKRVLIPVLLILCSATLFFAGFSVGQHHMMTRLSLLQHSADIENFAAIHAQLQQGEVDTAMRVAAVAAAGHILTVEAKEEAAFHPMDALFPFAWPYAFGVGYPIDEVLQRSMSRAYQTFRSAPEMLPIDSFEVLQLRVSNEEERE